MQTNAESRFRSGGGSQTAKSSPNESLQRRTKSDSFISSYLTVKNISLHCTRSNLTYRVKIIQLILN